MAITWDQQQHRICYDLLFIAFLHFFACLSVDFFWLPIDIFTLNMELFIIIEYNSQFS